MPNNVPRQTGGDAAKAPVLFYLTAAMLAVALLVGGSGDYYPLCNLAIELLALLVLWFIAIRPASAGTPRLSLLPRTIIAGMLALILAQLIPLPAQLWHQLPGRQLETRLLEIAGLANAWRPFSLDPAATLSSALQILPGLAAFFAILHLDDRHRQHLLLIVIAAGLLSALLGAVQQMNAGIAPFVLFETTHWQNSPGLFVNRNHQATFLLITMLVTAGAARSFAADRADSLLVRIVTTGAIALLAAATLITASRTGFGLLVPTAAAALLILYPIKLKRPAAAAILLGAGALILLLARSEAVRAVIQRFSETDERPLYWRDTMTIIAQYWPFGSGFGTFPEVFAAAQSIETIAVQFVNNAHNDYLELALEGGAPAIVLLGLFLLYCLCAGLRLAKRDTRGGDTGGGESEGENASIGIACLAAIGVILLHSIVDYPLRMLSIMATFGMLAGLLVTSTEPSRGIAGKNARASRSGPR